MVRFIAGLVLGVQMLGGHDSPELSRATPGDVGMSQSVIDAARTLYSEAVAREEIAGAVLLVARHGKVIVDEAIGWSDRENRVPMTTGTVFDIASMTKPIIATATLILAERRQIDLDDVVSKYIPSFAQGRSSRITIRQLLNHTSGFRIPLHFVDPSGPRPSDVAIGPSLQAEVSRYPLIGPAEEPGAGYSYSNVGYMTLGAILEIVSRKPLPEVLKELIYEPLGMTGTFQLYGDAPHANLAKQYSVQGAELKPTDSASYPFAIGSGRTASTASDVAKFCQMYLNEGTYGNRRLLGLEYVKMATSISVRAQYLFPDPGQLAQRGLRPRWYYRRDGRGLGIDVGYGLGWVVAGDGTYSHPGVTGTFAWVDPSRDLVGIILTQSNDARNPGIEFIRVVNSAVDCSRSQGS